MSTQEIYVSYSSFSGKCRFFHPDGEEFNGDLVCPRGGRTFVFNQKTGSSGWSFSDIRTVRQSGPPIAFEKALGDGSQISLNDPGSGTEPESWYAYFLEIDIDGQKVRVDPKIHNHAGN
jgi:hypothetical protein